MDRHGDYFQSRGKDRDSLKTVAYYGGDTNCDVDIGHATRVALLGATFLTVPHKPENRLDKLWASLTDWSFVGSDEEPRRQLVKLASSAWRVVLSSAAHVNFLGR
jgi:hypothetical protein